jgi:ATP-binding cassette subfamily F protein 3
MAGELMPLDGVVRLGAAVSPGYLAQVRDRSFPGATVLDALLAQINLDNGPARSYLARFLFRGEDVFKPVTELSGGERSRLELALLGITQTNLLLSTSRPTTSTSRPRER